MIYRILGWGRLVFRLVWRQNIEPVVKKLWEVLRKKTQSKDFPVKTFEKIPPHWLEYLHELTPNLNEEEVERNTILSPTQYYMRLALLRDIERAEGWEIKAAIENPLRFRNELSDIAYYLYRTLNESTPKEWKKMKIEDPNLDAIRIMVALKGMEGIVGYESLLDIFRNTPEKIPQLIQDAIAMDELGELQEVGHGGAGIVRGGEQDMIDSIKEEIQFAKDKLEEDPENKELKSRLKMWENKLRQLAGEGGSGTRAHPLASYSSYCTPGHPPAPYSSCGLGSRPAGTRAAVE